MSNEENAGGPVEDLAFEASFARWWAVERADRTFFLAEDDDTAVGMANVKRFWRMPRAGQSEPRWWGYVGNVFVLPDHRNLGIGRILMQSIVSWASDQGAEHLRLAPSPRSGPFYSRLGFVPGSVVELDPPALR